MFEVFNMVMAVDGMLFWQESCECSGRMREFVTGKSDISQKGLVGGSVKHFTCIIWPVAAVRIRQRGTMPVDASYPRSHIGIGIRGDQA